METDGNDAQRILAMAKKLFPQYFELQTLETKMLQLQTERSKLADQKVRTSYPVLR